MSIIFENMLKRSLLSFYKRDLLYIKQPKSSFKLFTVKKATFTCVANDFKECSDLFILLLLLFGGKSKIYQHFGTKGYIFRKNITGHSFVDFFFLFFFLHKCSPFFYGSKNSLNKIRLKGDFYSMLDLQDSSFSGLLIPNGLYPFYIFFLLE